MVDRWPSNRRRDAAGVTPAIGDPRKLGGLRSWTTRPLWRRPMTAGSVAGDIDEAGEALLRSVAFLMDPLGGRPVPEPGITAHELRVMARQRRGAALALRHQRMRACQSALAAVVFLGLAGLASRPAPVGDSLCALVPPARICAPVAPDGRRQGGDGPGWWTP